MKEKKPIWFTRTYDFIIVHILNELLKNMLTVKILLLSKKTLNIKVS